MTRIFLAGAILAASVTALAASCIRIDSPDLSFDDHGVGAATMQWRAGLKNQCRKTFDADLTVQLLNDKEEKVYEFVEKATLGVEERLDINRDIYVPSRIVGQVNDFAIQIEERERLH